jgi:5-methylcytosine-specific restriction endonuclease McrA
MYTCSKCKVEREDSLFQKYKGKPSGQCRICKTEAMKAKRLADGIRPKKMSKIEEGLKLCLHCDTMKPLDQFSPAKRGLGGVAAYCKPCFSAKYFDREAGRQATSKYRQVNRERYLSNHRLTQYKRKAGIAAVSDGTVTDDFLKALYGTSECFYCENETSREDRTADHRVALNKGGSHSASNLVMACWTCNSSKRDLSEEEFRNKWLLKQK